ncbi:MAG: GAF domain-containing protein [Bacteroidota bacterium]
METKAITPLTVVQVIVALGIMFFLMRYLFKKSVLYKIGISTATVIILASFVSSVQSKLGPVHSAWSFPLQIILAVVAYFYISKTIKKPLLNLIGLIEKISAGNVRVKTDSKILGKNDEIGQIALSMDKLQQGLKSKADFAIRIGEGKFDDTFTKSSEDDELGEALIQMQSSLKAAREEEEKRKQEDKKRNWITEGQAKFADLLRQSYSDANELSYTIISTIVNYMGINQGGLFILNDENADDKFLELTACYAFDRRKFMEKRVDIGEGLAGTCFMEGQPIYLKEIPNDYIKITSGLGGENPSDLLLVPLKLNEDVFGVMELASFNPFEQHHIEFANKIGEIIASSISSLRINQRTTMLLEKSQQQAEEMRAQEEEMRQNMEELHATQEAMAEKERENIEIINQLREENEQLKKRLEKLAAPAKQ